jgi:hypothetical protein
VECEGWGVAATLWRANTPHPRTFGPADVSPALLEELRGDAAAAEAARRTAAGAFVRCAVLAAAPCPRLAQPQRASVFSAPVFNLTMRKFNAAAAAAVLRLLEDEAAGLLAPDAGAGTVR